MQIKTQYLVFTGFTVLLAILLTSQLTSAIPSVIYTSTPVEKDSIYVYDSQTLTWQFTSTESASFIAKLSLQQFEGFTYVIEDLDVEVIYNEFFGVGFFSVDLETLEFPLSVGIPFDNGAEYFFSIYLTYQVGNEYIQVDGSYFSMYIDLPDLATPDELTLELLESLQSISAKNKGVIQSLSSQLNEALEYYENGEIDAFEDKINHFVKKVIQFQKTGKLSLEDTARLINDAQSILNSLE